MNKSFIVIIIILYSSCSNHKNDKNTYVKSKIGAKLVLPELFIHNTKTSSINEDCNNLKIISYLDGNCSICKDELIEWNSIIGEYRKSINIDFIFYIFAIDTLTLIKDLKSIGFNTNYCIDRNDEFIKKNNLDYQRHYNTFLLDSSNSILVIGNPALNLKVKKLYKIKIENIY